MLVAMGLSARQALAAVRFSLGFATETRDIDALIEVLPRILEQVRAE